MKYIKKIIISLIVIILLINTNVYARYNYNFNIKAFSLTRDTSEILYTVNKSTEEYTNKDIVVEIDFNKEIESVEGFELTNKKLIRTVKENENMTFMAYDYSGNEKEISYVVNNIDKISPCINGIDEGIVYTNNLFPTYTDNIGIKDIKIKRYEENLLFNCYTEYYDTNEYKGIDVNKNSIYVSIKSIPKGTVKFKYYINNVLKEESDSEEYRYSNLHKGTEYDIKVEAINLDEEVVGSCIKKVKTKYFDNIIAQKSGETFNVTVTGLEPEITNVAVTEFSNSDRTKITYLNGTIQPDRSVNIVLNAKDITQIVENGYYYVQFHLKNSIDTTVDLVGCNIIFNTNYIKENNDLNPNYINQNGYYEIIVTDVAGNETKKCFYLHK